MKDNKTRRLKVEHRSVCVPIQIRLKGKWLERAGFAPGTHVQVTVETGKLTIETIP